MSATDRIYIDAGKGVRLRMDVAHLEDDGSLLLGAMTSVEIDEASLPWQPAPEHLDEMKNWARILFPGAHVYITRRRLETLPEDGTTPAAGVGGGSSMGGRLS